MALPPRWAARARTQVLCSPEPSRLALYAPAGIEASCIAARPTPPAPSPRRRRPPRPSKRSRSRSAWRAPFAWARNPPLGTRAGKPEAPGPPPPSLRRHWRRRRSQRSATPPRQALGRSCSQERTAARFPPTTSDGSGSTNPCTPRWSRPWRLASPTRRCRTPTWTSWWGCPPSPHRRRSARSRRRPTTSCSSSASTRRSRRSTTTGGHTRSTSPMRSTRRSDA